MNLERLIAGLAPIEVVGRRSVEISDLAYDARRAVPGALFFCVRGERADGHDFAPEAIERGAAALVVERRLDLPVPQVVVASSRRAMAPAADGFFGRPTQELTVAGVTGTNGKTTTAYLLHGVLVAAGLRPGLLGTVETRVGSERRPAIRTTAEAIDLQRSFRELLDAGNESCAMEATSHGSELHRLDCVRFAVLVFTNLSQDHLDFHGTMERYFEAKRRLFAGVPAAVNIGDEWGRRLARELQGERVLTFGLTDDADIRPDDLELESTGARLRIGDLELTTPLLGRFNVENVLGTVAGARLLGIDDEAVAAGIASVSGVPGRFETIDEGQPFRVIVDYSHKPGALENVLRTARGIAEGRVFCVFGCGGDRDRGKRALMGRIARELADVAVVTSDNPRSEDALAIIGQIVAGAVTEFDAIEPDRAKAIECALECAETGDVVVIAGKGHEQGQELADRTIPFDDRVVAREALRRLGARA